MPASSASSRSSRAQKPWMLCTWSSAKPPSSCALDAARAARRRRAPSASARARCSAASPPSPASQAWRPPSARRLAGARHAEHEQRRGGVRHDLALALGEAPGAVPAHPVEYVAGCASSTTSLEHDWLGACRRSAEGRARGARRRARRAPSACVETGRRRRRRRPHAGHRPARRGPRRSASCARSTTTARASRSSPRSAASLDFGDPGTARRRRPDRRLAERQARPAAPRAVDRRRRRPDDGATWCSATSTTSAPARSGTPSAARARGSTARRWTASRPSGARPTGGSRSSPSSPPRRAGSPPRPTRCSPTSTACARSARSRSRCARSPPAAPTRWPRCAAAARSTRPPPS